MKPTKHILLFCMALFFVFANSYGQCPCKEDRTTTGCEAGWLYEPPQNTVPIIDTLDFTRSVDLIDIDEYREDGYAITGQFDIYQSDGRLSPHGLPQSDWRITIKNLPSFELRSVDIAELSSSSGPQTVTFTGWYADKPGTATYTVTTDGLLGSERFTFPSTFTCLYNVYVSVGDFSLDNIELAYYEYATLISGIGNTGVYPLGTTTNVYEIDHGAAGTSICSFNFTVRDIWPPVAACKDATVYLDGSGSATVSVGDVDDGSSDFCGLDDISVGQWSEETDFVSGPINLANSSNFFVYYVKFVPDVTKYVTGIDLYTTSIISDRSIKLLQDACGASTLLGISDTVNGQGWMTFTFPEPIPLTAGEAYYFAPNSSGPILCCVPVRMILPNCQRFVKVTVQQFQHILQMLYAISTW